MKSLLACVLFAFLSPAFAKPCHGYIVFNDGRVDKVIFDIPFLPGKKNPDYIRLQNKVKYQYNFRTHNLRPEEAEGYFFFNEQDTIRMLKMDFEGGTSNFVKINIDGKLTLYDFYPPHSTVPSHILQLGGNAFSISSVNFSNTMMRILSTCSFSEDKPLEEAWTSSDIEDFVRWYNSNCSG